MIEKTIDLDADRQDDSLPLEIRGARRQLTDLLAKWQRQARGLLAVNNIARVVVSSKGLEEILAVAMDEIQDSLGVASTQVILLDPSTGQLIYHSRSGARETPSPVADDQGPESVVRQVIESATSLRMDHLPGAQAGQGYPLRLCATLCVPLLVCDRVVGAVQVTNKLQHRKAGKAPSFDEHDQEVLEGVAAFVAMAVENARLQETTRTQAAAQALQETVVTLAHYVNNPLQGMVAAAELLQEQLERILPAEGVTPADEKGALSLVEVIIENAQEISAVLRLLQDVGLPGSTTYVGSQQMLDIEEELKARREATEA